MYNEEILSMEKEIKILENEFYRHKNSEKLHNLTILRAKYDKLMTDKVAKSLLWTKQAYYDQGQKAGKLLAWRIKKMQADKSIKTQLAYGIMHINILDTNHLYPNLLLCMVMKISHLVNMIRDLNYGRRMVSIQLKICMTMEYYLHSMNYAINTKYLKNISSSIYR